MAVTTPICSPSFSSRGPCRKAGEQGTTCNEVYKTSRLGMTPAADANRVGSSSEHTTDKQRWRGRQSNYRRRACSMCSSTKAARSAGVRRALASISPYVAAP